MPQENNNKHHRHDLIDLLRGIAIVMMFTYHFSWDLNNFNYIRLDFYHDPFWLHYRTFIVSMFLGIMGVSLYLAHSGQFRRHGFLKRLYWLIACSALISVTTLQFSGERFIYFGILHFITVASLLALPFVRLYWLNLVSGLLIIIMGTTLQHSWFDPRYLNWIGFATDKPPTDDYVPLFPWFGVVLLGMFIGRLIYHERKFAIFSQWNGYSGVAKLLCLAGRHSLIIYMVHQPIFIGILYAINSIF